MTEKVRVYCGERKKYETLIDLIVSAAYHRPVGVIERKEINFREKLDGFEFVFPGYFTEIYKNYLNGKYRLNLKHLGI